MGVRTTVFDFAGTADKLVATIKKVEGAIRRLPDHKDIDINAQVAKALADVQVIAAELEQLEHKSPEITPHLNLRRLIADQGKARAIIESLPDEKVIEVKLRQIDLRREQIVTEIDRLEKKIEELNKLDPQIEVDLQLRDAYAKIAQFQARKNKLLARRKNAKAELFPGIDADLARISSQVDATLVKIDKLRASNPQLKIDAQVAAANAKIDALMAKATLLDQQELELKVDVDRQRLHGIQLVEGIMERTTTAITRATSAAEHGSAKTFNFAAAWARVSTSLRRIGPILMGIAIILIASLLPAIAAVVIGLAGAAAGVGALASAFVSALGPAAIVLIGLFQRLAKVLEAFQTRQQALNAISRNTADDAKQAAAATSELAASRNAVRDATEGVATAERALGEAVEGAQEALRGAREANAEAIRNEEIATQELARAETDAYRQIRQAIEDVSDARRELAGAKIGKEEAKLDTREAILNLKELRGELGLAGDEIGKVFKKFTDVDVDTSGLSAALANATGGALGGEDQIELERAILAVRKARLGEKEANDRVSDSQRDLNEKTREANRLRSLGIAGVESYIAAQESLRDAQRTQAGTQRTLNELEQDGVKNAPGVIAAREGLRDAHQQLTSAMEREKDTRKKLRLEEAGAVGAMALYKEQREKLTSTEKGALDVLIKLADGFKSLQSGTDAVIGAMAGAALALAGGVEKASGALNELAQVWADNLTLFSQQIFQPGNFLKFQTILQGAIDLSRDLGRAFNNAFQLLINVGAAAMPLLTDMVSEFADWLGGLSQASSDTGALREKIKPMVDAFKLFVGIIKEVGDVLVSAFIGASEPINDFLKFIKDGFAGLAETFKTPEGQERLKEFFEDVLPFAKSFIKFLVKIGKVFVDVFQIMAPILKPIVDGFNFLLDVLHFLLRTIDWIIGPIKGLIGFFASLFVGVGAINKALGWVLKSFGKFGGWIAGIGPKLKSFGGKLIAPFRNAWGTVRGIFNKLPGWLGGPLNKVMDVIETILKTVGKVLIAPFRGAWEVVLRVFNAIRDPLKKAAGKIWDGIKSAFKGVRGFFDRVFGTVVDVIKTALNGVIRVLNLAIQGINKVTPGEIKVLGRTITKAVPDIPQIPLLASGGIARRGTLAGIGEAGPEAIIPLSPAVLASLGQAIVKAMSPSVRASVAGADGGGRGDVIIKHQEIKLEGPAIHDPEYAATRIMRKLKHRGRGNL